MLWNDSDTNCTMGDWFRELPPNPAGKHNTGDPRLIDRYRHKGRIIVAFADGHVQNVMLSAGDLDKISMTMGFTY